jgi:hypothetical protein
VGKKDGSRRMVCLIGMLYVLRTIRCVLPALTGILVYLAPLDAL